VAYQLRLTVHSFLQDLDEMNIEIIRNTLYKSYLESFCSFCRNIGDETGDVMCEILGFEADRRFEILNLYPSPSHPLVSGST
jgi:vacuolar-type H+-ATPase subunit C/Vma6